MLCALAASDAVRQVSGLVAALKWPNDLIVEDRSWRKLAGILTETGVVGAQMDHVVVGIGINVNVPSGLLTSLAPNATSILAETGQSADRVTLMAAFLAGVERRYEALRVGQSPHPEWVAALATLGRPVKAITAEATVSGVAESVDLDGALLLRTPDGTLHRFLVGDVTLDHP
jgi:BirA family biotin operon repressor/biotin-[acetyl-CoA-carboxylase] ligase